MLGVDKKVCLCVGVCCSYSSMHCHVLPWCVSMIFTSIQNTIRCSYPFSINGCLFLLVLNLVLTLVILNPVKLSHRPGSYYSTNPDTNPLSLLALISNISSIKSGTNTSTTPW